MDNTILRPTIYDRYSLPEAMRHGARRVEESFKCTFSKLFHFSPKVLARLHEPLPRLEKDLDDVQIGSFADTKILPLFAVLNRVANTVSPSLTDRKLYLESLIEIYRCLLTQPSMSRENQDSLVIGPDREGRILGSHLDWFPDGRSIFPIAKRIHVESGLLIGLAMTDTYPKVSNCVIIDGAIATGATIISVLCMLHDAPRNLEIRSVHSTSEGIRAIQRFCRTSDIRLIARIGHVTPGLDNRYYGIMNSNSSQLAIGDIGDLISELSD